MPLDLSLRFVKYRINNLLVGTFATTSFELRQIRQNALFYTNSWITFKIHKINEKRTSKNKF